MMRLEAEQTVRSPPPPKTVRWVASRKASLVLAINQGLLTVEEACAQYSLSVEELSIWQTRLDRHGLRGLHVSRAQTDRALLREPSTAQRGRERPDCLLG
jgi:hypothetical protein